MKLNRTSFFIGVSSLALVIVLVIQLNWIFQTAAVKEALFNEKANIVLAKTTEGLAANPQLCQEIEAKVASSNATAATAKLGDQEIHAIDSLFRYYMAVYNIHIDYSFEVIKPSPFQVTHISSPSLNFYPGQPVPYQKRLAEAASEHGFALKLIFPEKREFIIAEMGIPFVTSVVLILVVLVLFWRTVLSLTREKQLSEHTSEFLNNMTHEFKTPLTNIALAGRLLLKGTSAKQDDKTTHYSEIILEENEKLRLQVEQVLSMTAFERGEIPLQKTELDFHQLIHGALKAISLQIEGREGRLSLQLNADQFVVTGDKTHLTNALCNIIDNAIKYSTGKPDISIATSNTDGNLVISISDKGIGIKREHQKKVFDKFFRVPTGDVHDVKGFGLGLAYTKKIIELHGGTIVLHSEPGKGTSFTTTLPYG